MLTGAHRFVLSFVYELPSPSNRDAFFGKVLGGWSAAGVVTFQTGQPLTIIATNANNIYGITGDRAELSSSCTAANIPTPGSIKSHLNNYFNANCFTSFPVIGADGIGTDFGNSGVGIVTGPGQANLDLSVIKRTGIHWLTEAANLEVRGEMFNTLNTAQFANPVTDYSSSSFGQIQPTSVGPRIIQLALKLNF